VIATLQAEEGASKESEFELNLRVKLAEDERIKQIIAQEAEWAKRK